MPTVQTLPEKNRERGCKIGYNRVSKQEILCLSFVTSSLGLIFYGNLNVVLKVITHLDVSPKMF